MIEMQWAGRAEASYFRVHVKPARRWAGEVRGDCVLFSPAGGGGGKGGSGTECVSVRACARDSCVVGKSWELAALPAAALLAASEAGPFPLLRLSIQPSSLPTTTIPGRIRDAPSPTPLPACPPTPPRPRHAYLSGAQPQPPQPLPPQRPRPSFPRWTPAPSAWMPTSPASATPSPRTRPSQPTSRRPPRRAPAPAWLALPSTPSNGPRSCRQSSTARSGQTGSCWRLMGAR